MQRLILSAGRSSRHPAAQLSGKFPVKASLHSVSPVVGRNVNKDERKWCLRESPVSRHSTPDQTGGKKRYATRFRNACGRCKETMDHAVAVLVDSHDLSAIVASTSRRS